MSSGRVNDLLHRARGEQYRHSQNLRRSRTHIAVPSRNLPSLPFNLIDLDPPTTENSLIESTKEKPDQRALKKYSGPDPPKSWTLTAAKDVRNTAAWRKQALAAVFAHRSQFRHETHLTTAELIDEANPKLPSLVTLCLEMLVNEFTTSEFIEDIVPCLPPHLRLQLLRYTAVHSPLSGVMLQSLLIPDGHTDGELIVVGPSASLRGTFFLSSSSDMTDAASSSPQAARNISQDWDDDDGTPNPLQCFIYMSTRLSPSLLLSLPPSITHLALINLPTSIALHRLPGVCPLIKFLDLSYNTWLNPMSTDAANSLSRLDWDRWSHLRTLCLRESSIPEDMLVKVNKNRWDEVGIIR
ncbi:hypothetical protein D9758_000609 [Tetrapyrgos nigripes]|uniref:Uncharacterized protein n=1 Tax=Tetrapyrgos nigripes TaxID=182062 RepID=A0A8H5LY46_9AGAR|nr:hypothetical protein D9758_000609 [Tetrapyrgos nigripes]